MKKLEKFQKGVNLGGWLSQGSLEKEHLDSFILEEDIARIASWGADHVRLPVDFENIETDDGKEKPEGYAYIDNCIEWCKKYGLNLVLDLHKTCGYIFDDKNYSADFFDNEPLQDRFVALWKRLAARYARFSDMMMFEMLNEVVRFDVAEKWNQIALRCMRAIREYAPTVKILYGGVCYNAVSTVKLLAEPIDENIVYNFHCYEPLLFTHQTAWWVDQMPKDFHINYPASLEDYLEESRKIAGTMVGAFGDKNLNITKLGREFFEEMFREAIEVAEKRNVPLYCGEYGVIDQAPTDGTLKWFEDIHAVFEQHGIGRAVWSYKKMDFGWIDEHYSPILDRLIKLL